MNLILKGMKPGPIPFFHDNYNYIIIIIINASSQTTVPSETIIFPHPSTFMASCSQNPKLTQMRKIRFQISSKKEQKRKHFLCFSFCLNGERVKRKKPQGTLALQREAEIDDNMNSIGCRMLTSFSQSEEQYRE